MAPDLSPENVARVFHTCYEALAPAYGYETREDTAKSWENVPENNRQLMAATARHVTEYFGLDRMREALVAIALVCKDEKVKGNPLDHDAIRDVARYGLGMEEDDAEQTRKNPAGA